jgi:hypothetical protein
MSDRELSRLEVLRDLDQKRLTTKAAGQLLGLERRQVFRLLKAYRSEGPSGLISKRRGRRSNRRKPEALRRAVLTIIRQWYWDFGPTLAAEKLREDHGIAVGRETLRQWMIEAGLWRDRKQRKQVHQPRPRRECVGELVQVDGSEHWWFEDRGPQCTLLVFVDDATSRLMHLQFVESESTFAYFHAARAYLEAWGKPVAFYSEQARGLPGQPSGCAWRRRHDPIRPGIARAQHRHHLRQFEPGEGAGRTCKQNVAGPAGQGIAAGGCSNPGGWQRPAPGFYR